MNSLISLLVLILVLGLVVWVAFTLLDLLGLPAPYIKIARIVVALVVLLFLLQRLLPFLGVSI